MNLSQLIYINIKRSLRDPGKLFFMIFLPLFVILFGYFAEGESNSSYSASSNASVAYNIEDESDLVEELFSVRAASQYFFIKEKNKALDLLETNEVAVVYNIPADFTEKINNYEKPIIQSYKREEGNVTIQLEIEFNNKLNELIKEKLLIDKGIISDKEDLYVLKTETIFQRNDKIVTGDWHSSTLFIIYFIIIGSSFIVNELILLKKHNILSRSVTTPNKSGVILGSFVVSLLFFQVAANMFVLIIGKIFIGYDIVNIGIIFINIILASLFSITLSLFMTRIFDNEVAASTIATLISIVTLLLSMFAMEEFQNVPVFIKNLGKFTPQYWIADSLEKSIIFPNVFIVLLIILALFSAGSYKLKDFAKN